MSTLRRAQSHNKSSEVSKKKPQTNSNAVNYNNQEIHDNQLKFPPKQFHIVLHVTNTYNPRIRYYLQNFHDNITKNKNSKLPKHSLNKTSQIIFDVEPEQMTVHTNKNFRLSKKHTKNVITHTPYNIIATMPILSLPKNRHQANAKFQSAPSPTNESPRRKSNKKNEAYTVDNTGLFNGGIFLDFDLAKTSYETYTTNKGFKTLEEALEHTDNSPNHNSSIWKTEASRCPGMYQITLDAHRANCANFEWFWNTIDNTPNATWLRIRTSNHHNANVIECSPLFNSSFMTAAICKRIQEDSRAKASAPAILKGVFITAIETKINKTQFMAVLVPSGGSITHIKKFYEYIDTLTTDPAPLEQCSRHISKFSNTTSTERNKFATLLRYTRFTAPNINTIRLADKHLTLGFPAPYVSIFDENLNRYSKFGTNLITDSLWRFYESIATEQQQIQYHKFTKYISVLISAKGKVSTFCDNHDPTSIDDVETAVVFLKVARCDAAKQILDILSEHDNGYVQILSHKVMIFPQQQQEAISDILKQTKSSNAIAEASFSRSLEFNTKTMITAETIHIWIDALQTLSNSSVPKKHIIKSIIPKIESTTGSENTYIIIISNLSNDLFAQQQQKLDNIITKKIKHLITTPSNEQEHESTATAAIKREQEANEAVCTSISFLLEDSSESEEETHTNDTAKRNPDSDPDGSPAKKNKYMDDSSLKSGKKLTNPYLHSQPSQFTKTVRTLNITQTIPQMHGNTCNSFTRLILNFRRSAPIAASDDI